MTRSLDLGEAESSRYGRALAARRARARSAPLPSVRYELAELDQPQCQWFAGCDNLPDGTVTHPILGDVPTCRRCADMLDLDLQPNGVELDDS